MTKKKLSEIEYEYAFNIDVEVRMREVYGLIFEELENSKNVFSFKFQKYESKQ